MPGESTSLQEMVSVVRAWLADNFPDAEPTEFIIRLRDHRGELSAFRMPLIGFAPKPHASQEPEQSAPVDLCSEWIKEALQEAGHRLTGTKIVRALQARGHEMSERTIYGRLASLVTKGELSRSSTAKPPGYGLPEWDDAEEPPQRED